MISNLRKMFREGNLNRFATSFWFCTCPKSFSRRLRKDLPRTFFFLFVFLRLSPSSPRSPWDLPSESNGPDPMGMVDWTSGRCQNQAKSMSPFPGIFEMEAIPHKIRKPFVSQFPKQKNQMIKIKRNRNVK